MSRLNNRCLRLQTEAIVVITELIDDGIKSLSRVQNPEGKVFITNSPPLPRRPVRRQTHVHSWGLLLRWDLLSQGRGLLFTLPGESLGTRPHRPTSVSEPAARG
jgi:hypothetical protein